jgi:F-type H+-transporting ATPase subunit gamma
MVYPFNHASFAEFLDSIDISSANITAASQEYSFEPSLSIVREKTLAMMSEIMMHSAILHHKTSEFAARMLAMKASKDNATQIIQDLTVQYNKIRQDTITKEIVEIV